MAASRAGKTAKPSAKADALVIRRVLNAPRELVFKVWTDPEHVWRWWGHTDFTTELVEWNPQEGGAWRARMRSSEGTDVWQEGVFLEIVESKRLVFSFIWGSDPGYEMLVEVGFAERDGMTEMTFSKGPFNSAASHDSEEHGWNQSFDRLAEYVDTPPADAGEASKQSPRPGPEHERLEVFVGTWNTEGHTRASASGPAAMIRAVDTYEWLPGGFFLVHHVDAQVGNEEIKVIEIIGYDASSQAYTSRYFDSQGNTGIYRVSVRDGIWMFAAESERATVTVSDDGNTMMAHWEQSTDGSNWIPSMDVTLTKA